MLVENTRMNVLLVKTNLTKFNMVRMEALEVFAGNELKWWISLLDYLARSKEEISLGIKIKYLRVVGDYMEL